MYWEKYWNMDFPLVPEIPTGWREAFCGTLITVDAQFLKQDKPHRLPWGGGQQPPTRVLSPVSNSDESEVGLPGRSPFWVGGGIHYPLTDMWLCCRYPDPGDNGNHGSEKSESFYITSNPVGSFQDFNESFFNKYISFSWLIGWSGGGVSHVGKKDVP